MFAADEYVMLSALQHFAFCPRQCALIHIEQVWEENIYTLRGLRVHEKVHQPDDELIEAGIRVERSLYLASKKYGIRGIADVVEFDRDNNPYPVEYKSGSKKSRQADSIQLCAQALCLEEMLARPVNKGAIFYHKSRRRQEIEFNDNLRSLTKKTIEQTRLLLAESKLPPPVQDKRCEDCSLIEACMPDAINDFAKSATKNNPFKLY
ncbi:MAG: CRISPR-associated protein Cas4 [Xenococcaceae cyanobacterium MO_188.B32]|nr:CRISPR-associated protein Cas4 [Xenococcaceae cyanobacterium MO_188.B32]